jgi:flagellar FlgN protein
MEILLNELLELLEDEIEIFRFLLPVFKKEEEAVLALDFNELNKASAEKEKLLFNMCSLEKKRTDVMNNLSEYLEVLPEELTLTKLAQSVKEPYSIQLRKCGLQLLKLTKNISNANAGNKNMFTHSLNFVKGALTLLQNIIAPGQVYHRTGQVQAERSASLEDRFA